ncbi:MAG: hypothetical protein OXT09_21400 [Myxococcales bacterium]|nr:hypothetical protein [Myxococcales bacterium]
MSPAAEGPHAVLQSLRDLPGVLGSFVHDGAELLCRDLPAYFDDEALAEAGPRAMRIMETWCEAGEQSDCVLRFEEQRLYLRTIERGILCVVFSPEVAVPALRTATGMVGRRLGGALSTCSEPAAPPPLPAAPPVPEVEPAPAAASPPRPPRANAGAPSSRRRARVYRGQRF